MAARRSLTLLDTTGRSTADRVGPPPAGCAAQSSDR